MTASKGVSLAGATEVLRRAGVEHGRVSLEPVASGHTVFRLITAGGAYYLKLHSKDLEGFGDAAAGAGELVRREAAAYACLAGHCLPAVHVVAAEPALPNPLAWPYILTADLPGTPLRDLLQARHPAWRGAVEAFGNYLAATHSIRFACPGYLVSAEGPAPDRASVGEEVHHRADVVLPHALRDLERARPHLPRELQAEVEHRLRELPEVVAGEYVDPRFVHGNPHLNHPRLGVAGSQASFAGYVDMDGASGGTPFEDVHSVACGMMVHAPGLPWWEPLFAGYGSTPDLERVRLALLSDCFYCFGDDRQASLKTVYRNLLAAANWRELFTAVGP